MTKRICLNTLLVLLTAFFSHAQLTTADILGTVTDNSGAALTSAKATLRNLGTNQERVAQINGSGEYIFTLLPPGSYSLGIEAPGFKTFSVTSVVVAGGDRTRLDAKMQLGQTSETVTVSGEVPALQTDSSTVGTAITGKLVQDLPLNGRNFVELALLVPGVSPGPPNGLATGTRPDERRLNSSFSVNGQDPVANNNLIDGMDNNERLIGTIGVRPSIDAIQEFRVQTNLYSAEIGRTSGGVVNILTKSGTNQYHGSLFEFLRNDRLDANGNYNFTGGAQLRKQKYRQNQFGGSVGGVIRKDKTFFFADYEGLKIRQGIPITAVVPTAKQRVGDFSENCTTGFTAAGLCSTASQQVNIVNANAIGAIPIGPVPFNRLDLAPYRAQLDPLGLKIAALYPLPNGPGINTTNYSSAPVRSQDASTLDGRVDHSVSSSWNIFGRYSFNDVTTIQPTGFPGVNGVNPGGLFNFAGPNTTRAQNVQLNSVTVLRPNLVLELKAGYLRTALQSKSVNDGKNSATDLGFPCNATNCVNIGDSQTYGLPRLLIQGYQELGDAVFVPLLSFNNTFQYTGAVNWNRGSHNLKFGSNLIRRRFTSVQSTTARGTFSFDASTANAPGQTNSGLANFLLGAPDTIQRTTSLYTPGYRSWESGFYMQDDWRVSSRLTLNLGLRYDIFTPRTEQYDRLANFDPINSVILIAQKNSNASAGVSTDYRGIAPRLGFAATLGHGIVLRGGWGISYFPGDFGSGVNLKNPPFTSTITCGTSTTGSFGNTGCPVGTGTLSQGSPRPQAPSQFPTDSNGNIDLTRIQPSTIQAVESKFRLSYNFQFNIILEKQFGYNVVSVGYIGTRGHNLAMIIPDINRALPSGTSNPNPRPYSLVAPSLTTIGYFAFQGRSTYDGMQVSFNRRFSRGLSLTSGFTYGDGKSNVTGTSTSTGAYGNKIGPFAQAIRNVQDYDWATTDFNVKYRWTFAGNYELPFGRSLRGASALVFGRWQVNGTAYWQTGLPFTVTDQTAVAGVIGLSAERPNLIRSDIRVSNPTVGSAGHFLDASAFSLPALYTLGNAPRNVGVGPKQGTINGSLFKIFPIRERFNLQFRTECFNVANHPIFGNPNTSFGNANFGKITTTAGGYTPRQLQFALKLQF